MHDTQTLVPAQELAATNKARYPNESAEYRTARNELLVEEIELRRHVVQPAFFEVQPCQVQVPVWHGVLHSEVEQFQECGVCPTLP